MTTIPQISWPPLGLVVITLLLGAGVAVLLALIRLRRRCPQRVTAPDSAAVRLQRLQRLTEANTRLPPLESALPELNQPQPAPRTPPQPQPTTDLTSSAVATAQAAVVLDSGKTAAVRTLPTVTPLASLDELLGWVAGYEGFAVARVPRRPRFFKPSSRLLVCHDYKGGYVEDTLPQVVAGAREG